MVRKLRVAIDRVRVALDRVRLYLALRAHDWARRTIADVRGRRGRDFIGLECDLIDRRKGILTELDQAEERRRVLSLDLR